MRLKYVLKFYLIGFLIAVISYVPTFFLEPTQIVKTIDNWFLFLYPIVLMVVMIRSYCHPKSLTFIDKLVMTSGLALIVVVTNTVLGLANFAEMTMNEAETEAGVLGINVAYGAILWIGGILISFLTKQKTYANTMQPPAGRS